MSALGSEDIAEHMALLGNDYTNGLPVVFVAPDGTKFTAHSVTKPHGEDYLIVNLVADEVEQPKKDYEYLECRNCGHGLDECRCGDNGDFFDTRTEA